MNSNKFQLFFNGYLKAVAVSLLSLQLLCLLSTGVLNWLFIIYVVLTLIASVVHFFFVFLLYIFVFPLITSAGLNARQFSFRRLMDKYVPFFAIPFAIITGLLWMKGCLNKFFIFVILDVLFTCYIGLYYYVKNKCMANEIA